MRRKEETLNLSTNLACNNKKIGNEGAAP